MKKYLLQIVLICFFPIGLLLNYFFSINLNFVEKYYSTFINKYIIQILSHITNPIPFSLYELTIIIAILILIIYIAISIKKIFNKTDTIKHITLIFTLNCLSVISIAYFLFVLLWGLNYNRLPLSTSLVYQDNSYTKDDLVSLYKYLIYKTNDVRKFTPIDENNIATTKGNYESVLERAPIGYDIASMSYEILSGSYGSPKKLLFSEFFNYAGLTGIYFPFTAQPGVNINAPAITIPATTLHEMAHQRGFAREDEANFIAFLVSTFHPDTDFQYSGYLLALNYTGSALYKEDSQLYKEINKQCSSSVLNDRIYINNFWSKYSGIIDTASSKINDTYLKSNGIKDGEKSYGRMVDLLLGYYFKNIVQ